MEFNEIFSPVKHSSIQMILELVVLLNLEFEQMDIKKNHREFEQMDIKILLNFKNPSLCVSPFKMKHINSHWLQIHWISSLNTLLFPSILHISDDKFWPLYCCYSAIIVENLNYKSFNWLRTAWTSSWRCKTSPEPVESFAYANPFYHPYYSIVLTSSP